jgi:hypothetical protein
VPTIGVLKIVLSYSRNLKPFVILLGDDNGKEKPEDPTTETPPVKSMKKDLKEKDPKADVSKV